MTTVISCDTEAMAMMPPASSAVCRPSNLPPSLSIPDIDTLPFFYIVLFPTVILQKWQRNAYVICFLCVRLVTEGCYLPIYYLACYSPLRSYYDLVLVTSFCIDGDHCDLWCHYLSSAFSSASFCARPHLRCPVFWLFIPSRTLGPVIITEYDLSILSGDIHSVICYHVACHRAVTCGDCGNACMHRHEEISFVSF